MEIRKGQIPPAVQNETSATESNKTSEASQVQAKDSSLIGGVKDPSIRPIRGDILEKAEPLNKFQTLEGQAKLSIVDSERFQLKERLQEAVDATLGLRMKNSGASASEIAAELHAGGESAEDVAKELKDLGFSGEEVAVALRNEYRQNPVEMAETMKSAGFDATEIAKGLKEALSQDSGQVRDILERLGYSQTEIADAMWGAFQIGEFTTLD